MTLHSHSWANIRIKSRSKRIYVPCVHCSTVYRGMDTEDMVNTYNGILLSLSAKDIIMPFAATWMHLETVTLSQIKSEKEKYYMTCLVCGI